jgi:preprotein translocase subunit SecE
MKHKYVKIGPMDKNVVAKKGFAQDIVGELKKVTWPTRKETIRLTTVVIVISLIIGLYVGTIDVLLAKALDILSKLR